MAADDVSGVGRHDDAGLGTAGGLRRMTEGSVLSIDGLLLMMNIQAAYGGDLIPAPPASRPTAALWSRLWSY